MTLTRDEKGRFAPRIRAAEEFWSRVHETDGCWPWTGATDKTTGYGRLSWEGRYWSAHRLAVTLSQGPIPPGRFVLHACDNPVCCNPVHLSVGTNADNVRDAARKNRMHPGEHHGRARLSDAEVVSIRARLQAGESGVSIATVYGVHPNTIYSIKSGQNWTTVR